MHHKRGRARNQRAGCKLCKSWKVNGAPAREQLKPSELRLIQPDERHLPAQGKGSRTKWCRGKVGQAHQPVCVTPAEINLRSFDDYLLVCAHCGKTLKRYSGSTGMPKPDWVTK